MKARAASPELVVDLNRIEDLSGIAPGRRPRDRRDDHLRRPSSSRPRSPPRGRSSATSPGRSPTCRCATAARSAATSAPTTRPTTFRRCSPRSTRVHDRGRGRRAHCSARRLLRRRLHDRRPPRRAADDVRIPARATPRRLRVHDARHRRDLHRHVAATVEGGARIAIGCVAASRSSPPRAPTRPRSHDAVRAADARPAGRRPRARPNTAASSPRSWPRGRRAGRPCDATTIAVTVE